MKKACPRNDELILTQSSNSLKSFHLGTCHKRLCVPLQLHFHCASRYAITINTNDTQEKQASGKSSRQPSTFWRSFTEIEKTVNDGDKKTATSFDVTFSAMRVCRVWSRRDALRRFYRPGRHAQTWIE